ncbi:MAG: hypothetical protein NTY22_07800, partial [Proteobacteria bacterium]|nr:hypothetical protein [Pseudomonadota bacterium]
IFPNITRTLFSIINKLIIPVFAKKESVENAWLWFRKYFIYLCLLFIGIGVIGFISIEFFTKLFFTEKYIESAVYAKWLWLILSLAVPMLFLSSMLTYQKKTRYLYLFSNLNVLVKFGGFILFIPRNGLWGIVYSNFAGLLIASLFTISSLIYYKRR